MTALDTAVVKRAVRFGLTGVLVTGVHALIAIAFMQWVSSTPPLANGVAFAGATILSYSLNTLWSFSARLQGKTLWRFAVVSLLGFCLAILIAWIVQVLGWNYFVGIAAVALTLPPISFLLHSFWTYR